MKKLLVLVVVLGAVLLLVDRAAVVVASSKLQERVQQSVHGTGEVSASIESFPFLGRVLANGSVTTVHARVDRVATGRFTLASVIADLHGVTIDRDELFRSRRVRLTGLERGTITAELTQEEVSRALRNIAPALQPEVRFLGGGRASLSVRGARAVEAGVQVSGGALTLRPTGVPALPGVAAAPLAVPIPRATLLPCAVQSVTVLEGRIRASCTVKELPAELAAKAAGG